MNNNHRVHVLPITERVVEVDVEAYVLPDGKPGLYPTRDGSAQYHGVDVWGIGPRGSVETFAVLSPNQCRELAAALVAEASRLELAEVVARIPVPPRSLCFVCSATDGTERPAGHEGRHGAVGVPVSVEVTPRGQRLIERQLGEADR